MDGYLTAKFETLGQAEAAATKLRSIRAKEVEIGEWQGGRGDDETGTTNVYTPMAPFFASGGNHFPGMGGGIAAFGMLPVTSLDTYMPEMSRRSYLLNALVADEQREMAVRIIRDCGGREI